MVRQVFPGTTIVRPGAMFGPGDALFSTLAELARFLPVLPLIGGGHTRLQPVFVEDVAEAIASLLSDPGTVGLTYELAGPGVYTLRELVSMTLRLMRKRRLLIPVPFAVAKIQARMFELLPSPPLSTGQVDLLKEDNVASGSLPGFQELKISAENSRGSRTDLYRPTGTRSILNPENRPLQMAKVLQRTSLHVRHSL